MSVSCSWVNPPEFVIVPSLLPSPEDAESVPALCVPSVEPSVLPSVLPSALSEDCTGAAAFKEDSPAIPKESTAALTPA